VPRTDSLTPVFVEYLPDALEEAVLYVSVSFATVAHRCCCGCGQEVFTPLSPTGWQLTFDGESVSLNPSIGNWSLDCQSHYWIKRNRVQWARRWSREEIAAGRELFEHPVPNVPLIEVPPSPKGTPGRLTHALSALLRFLR